MNSFDVCRGIERQGIAILMPWLQTRVYLGRAVLVYKGTLAREFQARWGDAIFNTNEFEAQTIEFKVEECHQHKNLFIEWWSNRSTKRKGWFRTLECDWLGSYFLKEDILYLARFDAMKQWSDGPGQKGGRRIEDFQLKCQNKYIQHNDTWGYCVPARILMREVEGIRRRSPRAELEAFRESGKRMWFDGEQARLL